VEAEEISRNSGGFVEYRNRGQTHRETVTSARLRNVWPGDRLEIKHRKGKRKGGSTEVMCKNIKGECSTKHNKVREKNISK